MERIVAGAATEGWLPNPQDCPYDMFLTNSIL
jgi:hypothetical protein